jgi:hypothetical protein
VCWAVVPASMSWRGWPRPWGSPATPVVRALFGLGAPVSHGEAWGRMKALVMEHDERLAFTGLDLFTETREPGSHPACASVGGSWIMIELR